MRHSFSSTSTYETCAHRYEQVNYLKVYKDTEHPAAARGNEIHDALDVALGSGKPITGKYSNYNDVLDYVNSHTGLKIPEMMLAIDRAWNPCDFWAKTVWYSGKIDVTILNGTHVTVFDYKTGKHRLKARQANDYGLLVFLHYPFVETMDFQFIWTDAGVEPDTFKFDRQQDSERMLEAILDIPGQIERSCDEDDWPQVKSGLCNGYCPVVSCPHYKPPKQT